MDNTKENSNQELNKINTSSTFKYFPFFNHRQAIFVLVLIGFVFYCTTFKNEAALDDGIVIHQNADVLKGIRGIKNIMTHDVYESFYKRMCASDQLQGGRYRPLSILSFALEQEIIGTYRTGYYVRAADMNHNGKLDNEEVTYKNDCGKGDEMNYEFNAFIDLNNDNTPQEVECYNCWDTNKNFKNDFSEDINADGVFNEVDCQVAGSGLRHFNNTLIYILACIFLYLLLSKYLFKSNQDLAFLSALLFLTHPIHSEIVANVRGRDDILSVMFICLSLIFVFKYMEVKKLNQLILSGLFFLLALLSKEYAILLLILMPLAVYVFSDNQVQLKKILLPSVLFFLLAAFMITLDLKGISFGIPPIVLYLIIFSIFAIYFLVAIKKQYIVSQFQLVLTSFFGITLFYLALRLHAVNISPGVSDTEILNNPYLLANNEEKLATKIFILFKYLSLLIFPNHLSSDYSYATFSYRHFASLDFIFSLLLHLVLLILGIQLSLKKHLLGVAILSYLFFIIMVSNLFFGTGIMMLEGNLFHASIGFAIAMAWLILELIKKINHNKPAMQCLVLLSTMLIVVFLYGCKTWERNWDWKNDITLFLKDVKNNPNSVLILGNAGARWIDLADTKEITGINYPGDDSTRYNDYNGTLKITNDELIAGGFKTKKEAALNIGIGYLLRAVTFHPRYVNGYLNLGLAYFKLNNDAKAILYWKIAEYYYPNNPYLRNYYEVYSSILKSRGAEAFEKGDYNLSLRNYLLLKTIRPKDAEVYYLLGGVYFNQKNYLQAKVYWLKCLSIDSNYEDAKKCMGTIPF